MARFADVITRAPRWVTASRLVSTYTMLAVAALNFAALIGILKLAEFAGGTILELAVFAVYILLTCWCVRICIDMYMPQLLSELAQQPEGPSPSTRLILLDSGIRWPLSVASGFASAAALSAVGVLLCGVFGLAIGVVGLALGVAVLAIGVVLMAAVVVVSIAGVIVVGILPFIIIVGPFALLGYGFASLFGSDDDQ